MAAPKEHGTSALAGRVSRLQLGAILSLVRQGLTVESEFGIHSLASLVSLAEVIEQSVYEPESLVRTGTGLAFRLGNPPLRTGAFLGVRLVVDGEPVPGERCRFRQPPAAEWARLSEVSAAAPLELRPGERTEIEVDGPAPPAGREVTIRLELRSVAVPPLVWFEFTAAPREPSA